LIYDSLFVKPEVVRLAPLVRWLLCRLLVNTDDEGYGECDPEIFCEPVLTLPDKTLGADPIESLVEIHHTEIIEVRTDCGRAELENERWIYCAPQFAKAQRIRPDRRRVSQLRRLFNRLSPVTDCPDRKTENEMTNCAGIKPNQTKPIQEKSSAEVGALSKSNTIDKETEARFELAAHHLWPNDTNAVKQLMQWLRKPVHPTQAVRTSLAISDTHPDW
jgi:hypothetical protein